MVLKKMASVGLLSVVSATTLLSGVAPTTSALAATHAPVSITVAAWNDAADALKAEIPGFNKAYPWIHVTVEYVDGSYQKITPELVAGTAPDIIQTQQRDFPTFLGKFPGDFVSLNSYLGPIKNQVAKVALNEGLQNGQYYAAPWDLGPTAMYYRKDLFKKAGINPNSIKTWSNYLAAGKKLVKFYHGKVKMLFENTTRTDQGVQTTMNILLNEQGGSYLNNKGQIDFTSPQMMKAMGVVQAWSKAGLIADAPTWNDGIASFSNGQVATILSAVWYAGTMMSSAPNEKGKWGIVPLPAFQAGGPNEAAMGGSVLAITKTSPNPAAAWDFIKYSLYTQAGEDVQLKYGLFPSWSPFYTDKKSAFDLNTPYFGMPIYKFFASVSSKIPSINYGPYFSDSESPLQQAYNAIVNGANPKTALANAASSTARLSGQSIASK